MEELKKTIAGNLVMLRTAAGMKQTELAEKINYSDKSVSKWERAESVPDISVLKNIADLFGVTVDYLITPHENAKPSEEEKKPIVNHRMITAVAVMGIFALAMLVFVILWLCGKIVWNTFVCALPVSLITYLVLNSVWNHGRHNFYIVSALMLSILVLFYFLFFSHNVWQIFLLAFPLEAIIFFGFHIITPRKH